MIYALVLLAVFVLVIVFITKHNEGSCTGQCRQGRLPCDCKAKYAEADSEGGEID